MSAPLGLLDVPTTRGERNNNPGNLRANLIEWKGKAGADAQGFLIFSGDGVRPGWFYGIRALARDVYVDNQGRKVLDTVAALIGEYAPRTENDSGAYIKAVCRVLNVEPHAKLDLRDLDKLSLLAWSIIRVENGRVIYPPVVIRAACADAQSGISVAISGKK